MSRALNDGRNIPSIGLGVYQSDPGEETYNAVAEALRIGYRHIDTASFYDNEASVGSAVRDSAVSRADIWITSKLWPFQYEGRSAEDAYAWAIAQAESSLEQLNIEYIDLYLLHAPPSLRKKYDARAAMWRALEEMQRRGLLKSIGVSNYGEHHLDALVGSAETSVVPAVNQIEVHPFLRRDSLVAKCALLGIAVEAYSPLAKARRLDDATLVAIAAKHSMTTAQIMIRWSLQTGMIALPKSVHAVRIAENFAAAAWAAGGLDAEDMVKLNALDEHLVTGWDPTVEK